MIDKQIIFEIHRLNNEGLSIRKIGRRLRMDRGTVRKYLLAPLGVTRPKKPGKSKLDPFKELIGQYLEQDPEVSAIVIMRKIQQEGYKGEITILRDYLNKKRPSPHKKRAYIRFESKPGLRTQVDWGHFGSLTYGSAKRNLSALTVIESHSRMIYVEFTHSQKQESLHQALFNAFNFFGGTPKELVVDNMLTAVLERLGSVIRYNGAFLEFLRPFCITPKACNIRAPYEKGKVENGIKYLRDNFWPLSDIKDLNDANIQVLKWMKRTANIRVHQTTGETPLQRFDPCSLKTLPFPKDTRYLETLSVKVHKDFAITFDGNFYTVPPWCVNKKLILKADQKELILYDQKKKVAHHLRCWEKRRRIELPQHLEEAQKTRKKIWDDKEISLFASFGDTFREYSRSLVKTGLPLKKTIKRLLFLKSQYDTGSLKMAIETALNYKAYGADYIENILYQKATPSNRHPPLEMKEAPLNNIRLPEICLEDYDNLF